MECRPSQKDENLLLQRSGGDQETLYSWALSSQKHKYMENKQYKNFLKIAAEPPGEHKNTGMSSLSLLQEIFLT